MARAGKVPTRTVETRAGMVAAKALPVCNPAPGIHAAGESGDLYARKNW